VTPQATANAAEKRRELRSVLLRWHGIGRQVARTAGFNGVATA
jgi:hypothetical protein